MVSYILSGLAVFVGWLLCGSINICFYTLTDGYMTKGEKTVAVAVGPAGVFILVIFIIVIYPTKWASIIGCRMAAFIEGVFKK